MNFKYLPYSVSKIECFQGCNKKFWFRYIEKPQINISVKHFEKGKLWHSVAEHVLKRVKTKFQKPDFKELVDQEYLSELSNAIKFVKSQFFLPYLQDIMIFKQLIEQPFAIDKDGNVQLVKDFKCFFMGYIDLLQYNDFDVQVIDWKTGGKSIDNIERNPKSTFQLDVYGYVAHKMFNPKNIVGKYVYMEHEHEYIVNNFNHLETWREILWQINKIEKCTEFERTENALCDWCEYRGICLE